MSAFKPTASQQAAIDSRGDTILVSAGAGSGKTKVITERLMSQVCHPSAPVDVDRFLIITYTRAAAAELRGRIMEELGKRIAEQPENRRLRRQSSLCSRAPIGTIHSFCSSILRENSYLLGLSPDFKIIDDERTASMKNAALDRVLEQRYEKADADFLRLADTVGAGRDDSRLTKLVLSLHGKMQCHARPHQWAQAQIARMHMTCQDVGDTPWGREVLDRLGRLLRYWCEESERVLAKAMQEPKIAAAYGDSLADDGEKLRELLRCTALGWDKTRACLPVEFSKLKILRNSPDPELSDWVKARRKGWKDAVKGIEKTLYAPSEKMLSQLAETAPAMEALLHLILDFDKAFCLDKRKAGFVDYSDLEHLTAQLLTEEDGSPTPLALTLSQRYTEIMVDEYQDVSRVQDTIFGAISRNGRNLFLVGDVKQSIYRFRLADPTIFTEKYESYADHTLSAKGAPRRILLQENFRSRKEILDCANAVFSQCMSRDLGELVYDEAAALKFGASYYEGSVPVPELMLLDWKNESEESEEEEQSPDKTALEAAMVGKKILSLMTAGFRVQGRPLQYDDICILMRAANSVGGVYRRELNALGIPVAAGQSDDFFSQTEISLMLSMLSVIDNPHQDIPLIAVLRSPVFGFDGNALSEIRAQCKTGDFYSALCHAGKENEKCAAFLSLLSELRRTAPDYSAPALLWELIHRLDMLALCAAMTNGESRRQRLMELLTLSSRFEATGYKGLHRFVLWLRQLSEKAASPVCTNNGERGVQIMTVHKSKGLEFPVVFLCDTARRFNRQDSKDAVLIHPELGLGPRVTDLQKRIEYPGLARNAISARAEQETLSEEMRLLYVALTRPKERLFITGTVNQFEKTLNKCRSALTRPMDPQVLSAAGSPLIWLIYAALADDETHLKMKVYTPDDAVFEERTSAHFSADFVGTTVQPPDLSPLSYHYPHKAAEVLPAKLTATELKSRQQDADSYNVSPAQKHYFRAPRLGDVNFLSSPTKRGIATHLALQHMDYSKTATPEQVEAEIERLREQRFLTAQDAALVSTQAIYTLFSSPLGERIRRADRVHREFKFSLLVNADEFFPDAQEEQLLLQGVVDCCLEENGKLVIVDYKTDYVRSEEEIRQRGKLYAQQLNLYALALTRIFHMELASCLLYFLSAGKILEIPQKDLQN